MTEEIRTLTKKTKRVDMIIEVKQLENLLTEKDKKIEVLAKRTDESEQYMHESTIRQTHERNNSPTSSRIKTCQYCLCCRLAN